MSPIYVYVVLWKAPLGTYGAWSDTNLDRITLESGKLRDIGYTVSPVRRLDFRPLRLRPRAKEKLPQSGGTTDA